MDKLSIFLISCIAIVASLLIWAAINSSKISHRAIITCMPYSVESIFTQAGIDYVVCGDRQVRKMND